MPGDGCPVACAPIASSAVVEAVTGPADEVLVHGERGTGKTIVEILIMYILAKRHAQAGYPLPFRVMWVHDSLLSASVKTARTLELPMWAGCWTLHDDRRSARFTLAGRQLIQVDFVGAADEASAQRLRMSCHHVIFEELVLSLSDSIGITEAQYELALSSMQRQDVPTPRRVAVSSTNPGAPESWPFRRFLSGLRPNTRAIRIPREDRLSLAEQAALDQSFASNPTLQRRLARGEWIMFEQGAAVAENFNADVHVATTPLRPLPQFYLAIGWDGGHSPSAVVGQLVAGQTRIFAALNDLHVGVLELIERQVLPWLQTFAPWSLANYGARLMHIIDPNMATAGQASIHESAEKVIIEKLGGTVVKGPVRWPPRKQSVLRPGHEGGRPPLQISPGTDTDLLIRALEGRWFYHTLPSGQIDQTGPRKPNSPWADVGDAFAYLCGWLHGGDSMDSRPREVRVETNFDVGRIGQPPGVTVESSWRREQW
jgi:hypothetical protein